ncbi:MAG: recombinase family protein [Flavobacteriales bacterium]|jgi:DNA invertase Pin-like site-specific DNA recombinase|nr:recombinase family protein [Flavobacteriales bacterium]
MKYVGYYRVSTQKQGNSGLGLKAQKTAVQKFLKSDDELIIEFEEIESGKNNQRPQLKKAIEYCKERKATLLIAKLDRLSRNVSFIYTLKESQVDFVCVDMPNASKVTIGIMAVLAQDERERISKRTKVALQELKAKGKKLGSPQNLTDKSRKRSIEVRQTRALNNESNKRATILISSLKKEGKSYQSIANTLNDNSYLTSRGNKFTSMAVKRLFDRYQSQNLEYQV